MPTLSIVAHRGASREAPENTLAAFERALALGADGIELDVHATSDGAVVVHHDPVPQPTAAESALAWRPFPALMLAEVRRLRVAEKHAIPTLDEVLELVGDRLTVHCELKGSGVVEHAAPLLSRHRGPCAMHSFDHRAVKRAAVLAPAIRRGVLLVSRLVQTTEAMGAANATELWPQREYVDAELVDEVHQMGGHVIVWTVNDPLEVRRVAALGVDAICTDDVAGTREALRSTFANPSA